MNRILILLLFTLFRGLVIVPGNAATIPITGQPAPELAAFDTAMTNFMRAHNVKGGALAVMHNGRLVLKRGYGWSDQNLTVPFDPDLRVRIASNSKSFTAAAAKALMDRGLLDAASPALSLIGIQPYNHKWGDARMEDIQVIHLVAHRSGLANSDSASWNTISTALGLDHPATQTEALSYFLSRPLGFNPGTRFEYSGPGYLALGRVIEKASGLGFVSCVQRLVARPWGLRGIQADRSEPKLRELDSPFYDSAAGSEGAGPNLASFPTGEVVPWADGAEYPYESVDSGGGLIASVESLVGLSQSCLVSHGPGSSPFVAIPSQMNGDRRRWRHLGKVGGQSGWEAGARSFNLQNTNGVDFAVFVNLEIQEPAFANFVFQLKRLTETTAAWPGDNSTRIALAAESFAVGEEEGELVIGVRRTGESAGSVSASYTVASGTAKAGIDFTPVSGRVQFADDEITALITIPILNNTAVDGSRDLTVVLRDPAGGARLGISRALVAIEDDDAPVVPPAIRIAEPIADAILTVGTNLLKTSVTPGSRPIAKVEFFAGPTLLGEENKPPYTLAWKPRFRSGRFLLTARVTDDRGRSSTSPPVSVILGTEPPASGARGLLREFWTRRPGAGLTNLTRYAHFPSRPTGWEVIENFEAPSNWGEYHGARLRGFLTPPRTGDYVFAISANDGAELWLSTDERAENKRLLAVAPSATTPGDWDNAPKSLPVPLQNGRKYYVEVLHKQRITGEHLAVGWHMPDGNIERPIPGERLIPFSVEPQPVLAVEARSASRFRYSLRTSSTRPHTIEASEDLINWLSVWTDTVPGYSHEFEEATAPNHPRRFYRARLTIP